MELNKATVWTRSAAAMLCAGLASAMAMAAGPDDPGAAASTTINQSDASQQTPSDARTAQDIARRLNADPHHLFSHVNVTVQNGVARLGGFVYSVDALTKAKQIATETPGITRVDSEMKVQRNGANDSQPD